MATRTPLVFLALLGLCLSPLLLSITTASSPANHDDDEDLSFLDEEDRRKPPAPVDYDDHDPTAAAEYEENPYANDDDQDWSSEYEPPTVDDKDVVALNGSTFDAVVSGKKYVMVEFYAPWCGHCQALAPEYAAAATELKAEEKELVLAKVDAAAEVDLANKFGVEGYPTMYFYIDGVNRTYNGERTKEAIVDWVKKKMGPSIHNITTTAEAEKILSSESKVAVAFLNSLTGPESKEFEAAASLEDDVEFYQTTDADIAKLFHINIESKRPAMVLLKKEIEKVTHFAGDFSKSVIADFVSANKHALVIKFTREGAATVFDNPIKKQVLLFTTGNDSDKYSPLFQEAAKVFKGKLLFVYVEMDNEDYGKLVADYFGISGSSPKVLGYTGNDDGRKFLLNDEITVEKIKSFGEDFLEDKLKVFYKSDPIPEENNGDVKVIVGNNFDEIVLDESKDVLLEIYAPWCGHCQHFEPVYNKLGKYMKGIDSMVIAKMDGTTNEHPRAKSDGFPTILFFPAGNKSFEPITFEGDRTVVEIYKFLKKYAAIPFKVKKPESSSSTKAGETVIETKTSSESDDLRDEL